MTASPTRSASKLVTVLACGSLAVTLAACSAGVTDGKSTTATASSAARASQSSSMSPTGNTGPVVTVPSGQVPATSLSGTFPTGATPPSTTSSGADGSTGSQLPSGFPLPHGARVKRSTHDGGEVTAQLSVPNAAAAYSFYRQALPSAGYRITHVDSALGAFEIRFTGHGCGGDSQVAGTPTGVAVQCDLV